MKDDLVYQVGFNNTFESEAVEGALPKAHNTPKKVPLDLYTEQLSGTAFTRPRNVNLRTWLYRQQPAAVKNVKNFELAADKFFGGEDPSDSILDPNAYRWSPMEDDDFANKDFISGMHLMGTGGDPASKGGLAIYMYMFQKSMTDTYFYNSDGDMMIVAQEGSLLIKTEMGQLVVKPTEICIIPRGITFAVHADETSVSLKRGYVLEIFKGHFILPELGPIGSNGLANARDFEFPTAWYEADKINKSGTLLNKFGSAMWSKEIDSTPLDVVAWHGNYLPFKYDLSKFCAVNSVTYDHLDPSIYTVLTSAGDEAGTALCDFVIFPSRWMSTDPNTFRPPWFHRNTMTEFMGLINGGYDAKEGFKAGGASLHSCMTAHGPDAASHDKAVADPCDKPTYFDGGLAFMFETSNMIKLSKYALQKTDPTYGQCWEGLPNKFAKN